jgi:hypothetical protein
MARIIVNSAMIRFPMGGINLWVLTWLLGIRRLGHEVFFIEDTGWENACFDAASGSMGNDCTYGLSVVVPLLERHGLGSHWCFIDHAGTYHGLSRVRVDELFRTADAFIDFEWGALYERAGDVPLKVFMDSEPGWFQIRRLRNIEDGIKLRKYDYYTTTGLNVGMEHCGVETVGIHWLPTWTPVLMPEEPCDPSSHNSRFTTIMGWQSNPPVTFRGVTYGQKDIEFEKFMELPRHVASEIEVAVSGPAVPRERLAENGWLVRPANEVARSLDSYLDYIRHSMGEFTVAKNSFVMTRCGWLGDREGVYLGHGKPVVVQDTGIIHHIPCGEGLFAVNTVEEAAEAIAEISADYLRHARAARELAVQYLSSDKVAGSLLKRVGLM